MFLRDLSAMSTSQRNTTHMMFSVVVLFGSIYLVNLRIIPSAKSCAHLKSCETLQVLQEMSCAKVPLQALVLNSRMSASSLEIPTVSNNKTVAAAWSEEYLRCFQQAYGVFQGQCIYIFGVDQFSQQGDGSSTILCRILFWGEGGGFNRYYPNKLHIINSFHFPSDWTKSNLAATSSDPEKKSWHTQDLREESCDFFASTCLPVCKWEAKLWSRPYEGS